MRPARSHTRCSTALQSSATALLVLVCPCLVASALLWWCLRTLWALGLAQTPRNGRSFSALPTVDHACIDVRRCPNREIERDFRDTCGDASMRELVTHSGSLYITPTARGNVSQCVRERCSLVVQPAVQDFYPHPLTRPPQSPVRPA